MPAKNQVTESEAISLERIAKVIVNFMIEPRQIGQEHPIQFILRFLQEEQNSYQNYSYLTAPYHHLVGNAEIARQLNDYVTAFVALQKKEPNATTMLRGLKTLQGFLTTGEWLLTSPKTKLVCALLNDANLKLDANELLKMLQQNSGRDFMHELDVVIGEVKMGFKRKATAAVAEAPLPPHSPIADAGQEHSTMVLFSEQRKNATRAFFESIYNAIESLGDPDTEDDGEYYSSDEDDAERAANSYYLSQ